MLQTFHHQLMGPQHPGFNGTQPAQWQFPDTANTSSIKYIGFRDGTPDLAWAAWTLIWRPNLNGTSKARLVAMDTGGPGYGAWEEIAVLIGAPNTGPTPQGVLVGEAIIRFAQQRKDKYIGFQVYGDGQASSLIWESRLMIEYTLSAAFLLKRMAGITHTPKDLKRAPKLDWLDLEERALYSRRA